MTGSNTNNTSESSSGILFLILCFCCLCILAVAGFLLLKFYFKDKKFEQPGDKMSLEKIKSLSLGKDCEEEQCFKGWMLDESGCCVIDFDYLDKLSEKEAKDLMLDQLLRSLGEEMAREFFERIIDKIDRSFNSAERTSKVKSSIRKFQKIKTILQRIAARFPDPTNVVQSKVITRAYIALSNKLGFKAGLRVANEISQSVGNKVGEKLGTAASNIADLAKKVDVKVSKTIVQKTVGFSARILNKLFTGPLGWAFLGVELVGVGLDIADPFGFNREAYNIAEAAQRNIGEALTFFTWKEMSRTIPFIADYSIILSKEQCYAIQASANIEYAGILYFKEELEGGSMDPNDIDDVYLEKLLESDQLMDECIYKAIKETRLDEYFVLDPEYGLGLNANGTRQYNNRAIQINMELAIRNRVLGGEIDFIPLASYTDVYRVPKVQDIRSTSDVIMEEKYLKRPMSMILDVTSTQFYRYMYCMAKQNTHAAMVSNGRPKEKFPGDYNSRWDQRFQMCDFSEDFCDNIGTDYHFNQTLRVHDCVRNDAQSILGIVFGNTISRAIIAGAKNVASKETTDALYLSMDMVSPVCPVPDDVRGHRVGCFKNVTFNPNYRMNILRNEVGCKSILDCYRHATNNNHKYFGMTFPAICGDVNKSVCFTGASESDLQVSTDVLPADSCQCMPESGSHSGLGTNSTMALYALNPDDIGRV